MEGRIIPRAMLEQRAMTAVEALGIILAAATVAAMMVAEQAVDLATVVQAVDQKAELAMAVQITDLMAADRVATPLMLQPDRLIVAEIMEPLEVEWPAMVQAVVMVSV